MLFLLLLFVAVILGVLFIDGGASGAVDEYCRMECWDEKVAKFYRCC